MKAIFVLLFVFLIQACLNSPDASIVITENNGLTEQQCTKTTESIAYGFAFFAETSGLPEGSEFSFYLDSPRYSLFECTIALPKQEDYPSTISCWANGGYYPLLDEENEVVLPKTLSLTGVEVVGWELLRKMSFSFCSQLQPTITFTSTKAISNSGCDSNNNNILTTQGSFSSSLQGQKTYLTLTDDYITYRFEPILYVDNKLAKAVCQIDVPNASNSGDEELTCFVNGQKNGVFFDTAAQLTEVQGTDPEVIRLKLEQSFNLKTCKSYFMKLSGFLLISLFLL